MNRILGFLFILTAVCGLLLIPSLIQLAIKSSEVRISMAQVLGSPKSTMGFIAFSSGAIFGRVGYILILMWIGVGILHLKTWARYFALLAAIGIGTSLLWEAWFLGPQMLGHFSAAFSAFWTLFTLVWFFWPTTRARFQNGFRQIHVAAKSIFIVWAVLISCKIGVDPFKLSVYPVPTARKGCNPAFKTYANNVRGSKCSTQSRSA